MRLYSPKCSTGGTAMAASSSGGNLKLVRGLWNRDFLDELEVFPFGAHDAQVDAAAIAFNKLAAKKCPECGKRHTRKLGVEGEVFIFYPADVDAMADNDLEALTLE
jgi:hypothetical protein